MSFKDIVLRFEAIQDMPEGETRDDAQNAAERAMARAGYSTADVNACMKLRTMDPDIAEGKIELLQDALTWGRGPLEP